MKRPLLFKFLAIGLLMLLLLIPLGMIGNSIDERRAYSEQVMRDIAAAPVTAKPSWPCVGSAL